MEISFQNMPQCLLHNLPIAHFCTSPTCKISNPMVCSHPSCINPHSHPLHQMISVQNFTKLLKETAISMSMMIKKTREYYSEVRQLINHEIEKKAELMVQALTYKYTHPIMKKLQSNSYGDLTPGKIFQLISFLRGSAEQKNSLENIKDEIYKEMEKIEKNVYNLFQSLELKKTLLFNLVDLSSLKPSIQVKDINTQILQSTQQFQTIKKFLKIRKTSSITNWELIYRASEQNYSAKSYREAIEKRGPLIMLFMTRKYKKFGCYLNCKVNKKEGWIADGTGLSFIFSLDHNRIYPIKQEAKFRVKTLFMGDKGPQIGSGCDIYISDQCSKNEESGANLGGSFELPGKIFYGSSDGREQLGGEQNFGIQNYEIFEVN